MNNQDSIFKKVLRNNLVITLIPLFLVIAIVAFLICANYRNGVYLNAQNTADEYAEKINIELSSSIEKSNCVLKYNYLINNLNKEYNTTTDVLEFLTDISVYFDTIYSGSPSESILLYFSNDTLFENRYLSRMENLKNSDEIFDYFDRNNASIYIEDDVSVDSLGKKYFSFYRKMPLNKGCILACRSYIPDNNGIQIVHNDHDLPSNYVSSGINENFSTAYEVDTGSIIRAYIGFISLFIFISFVFILVVIYLSRKTTLSVTHNINNFIDKLNEQDIFTLDLSDTSSDDMELAIIKKTLHSLISKVKEISQDHFRSEIEKQNLELELLQRKLDPHILYNSLSVIKLNAFRSGNNETVKIIDNLVAYYRAVLSRGNRTASIAEEISMLERYVTVCEISNSQKYGFTYTIPDELKEKRILHLSFQPFVENSISHGFSSSSKDCKIHISCHNEDDFVVFTITDNGYGMPPEKVNKLNNIENNDVGFGIRNALLRLKLSCGDDCSISYKSIQNEYTEVTIKLHTL